MTQPTLRHLDVEFCISVDGSFVHILKGVKSQSHWLRAYVNACQSDAGCLLPPPFSNAFYCHSTSADYFRISRIATEFCVSMPEILPWFHFTVNKVRHQQSNLSNARP